MSLQCAFARDCACFTRMYSLYSDALIALILDLTLALGGFLALRRAEVEVTKGGVSSVGVDTPGRADGSGMAVGWLLTTG